MPPHIRLLAYFAMLILSVVSIAAAPTNNVKRSLVQLTAIVSAENKAMRCTGFVIDAPRGLALTAEHCIIAGMDKLLVDGEPSEVVAKSAWLALVKVKPMTKPPVTFRKDIPKVGELMFGMGWAWGELFVELGRLVAGHSQTDLLLNGPFISGMSGGPVIDGAGRVVGVIQGGMDALAILSGTKEIEEFIKKEAH